VARASALKVAGKLDLSLGDYERGERALEAALALFTEAGSAWMVARTHNWLAFALSERGELGRAERHLRDAIRTLKPLEDRGALCETERQLAQLLVTQGRLEEAERLALDAREVVGAHDVTSRATTTMALGVVRAAQGRDEEAEALLREAIATVEGTDFRNVESDVVRPYVDFLAARGREAEAARWRARLAELRTRPARVAEAV
jgi:tetratricopeptide (TPR) repeat protein